MFGHGHVTPRADGAKARCGGPGICRECQRELAALMQARKHRQHIEEITAASAPAQHSAEQPNAADAATNIAPPWTDI